MTVEQTLQGWDAAAADLDVPPSIVAPRRHAETAADWQRRLAAIDGLELRPHPGDRDPRSRTLARFTPAGCSHLVRGDQFRLAYDAEGRLALHRSGRRLASIADAADIVRIRDTVVRQAAAAARQRELDDRIASLMLRSCRAAAAADPSIEAVDAEGFQKHGRRQTWTSDDLQDRLQQMTAPTPPCRSL